LKIGSFTNPFNTPTCVHVDARCCVFHDDYVYQDISVSIADLKGLWKALLMDLAATTFYPPPAILRRACSMSEVWLPGPHMTMWAGS